MTLQNLIKPFRLTLMSLVMCALASCALQPAKPVAAVSQTASQTVLQNTEIERLLAAMTLEQKVGQMAMLASYIFYDQQDGKAVLNSAKLDKALNQHHIGAFVNSPASPTSIELWHSWLSALDAQNRNTPKIPALVGTDSIHGASFTKDAVLLPQNIALAASRNLANAREAATITATDTKTTGVVWNFGPVLDVGRNPVWPRFEETFGESPLLVGAFGRAMTEAYEQAGVASSVKHFVGYSASMQGIDRAPAFLSDFELQRYHLAPFKQAIAAGASTVMLNSGSINGIPTHANEQLLQKVLRGELGFSGVIASDWADIRNLHTRHRIAATEKDAVALAINAGVDLVMVPTDFQFCDDLISLVREGRVSEEHINASVRRILKLKKQLGLFAPQASLAERTQTFLQNKLRHQQAARRLARESITLLKNDKSILPLAPGTKVLLVGPVASQKAPLHGAWSYSWQGADENGYPASVQTIADALAQRLGDDLTVWPAGRSFDNAAKQAAAKADVIVLALGEGAYAEQVGTIDDLNLPAEQKALVRAAHAAGKPVVAVFAMGRPRLIADIEPLLDGIVMAYRLGNFGAEVITNVLFGDVNPSGVLPFSYPKYANNILPFDHLASAAFRHRGDEGTKTDGYDPAWPFGFGLSYTSFQVTGLKVTPERFSAEDTLTVSFTVTNTGKRAGTKVLDIFSRDHYASLSPAVREHIAFTRVDLAAGQSETVTLSIPASSLGYIDATGARVLEAGTFSILVDTLEIELTCTY